MYTYIYIYIAAIVGEDDLGDDGLSVEILVHVLRRNIYEGKYIIIYIYT